MAQVSIVFPADQAESAPIGQAGPEPVQHHGGTVASAREKQHVGEALKSPGRHSPLSKPVYLDDDGEPASGLEIAVIAVQQDASECAGTSFRPGGIPW